MTNAQNSAQVYFKVAYRFFVSLFAWIVIVDVIHSFFSPFSWNGIDYYIFNKMAGLARCIVVMEGLG